MLIDDSEFWETITVKEGTYDNPNMVARDIFDLGGYAEKLGYSVWVFEETVHVFVWPAKPNEAVVSLGDVFGFSVVRTANQRGMTDLIDSYPNDEYRMLRAIDVINLECVSSNK
jgi:hypothetical protein